MSVQRYKKKPVTIQALQWTGNTHREMFDFLTGYVSKDDNIETDGDNFRIDHFAIKGGLVIKTLEGDHLATISDYIIKGVEGEFYPCKESIFKKTYELH